MKELNLLCPKIVLVKTKWKTKFVSMLFNMKINFQTTVHENLMNLLEIFDIDTLFSDIFTGRNFCSSQKPQNFCIFGELNFAVNVLE